MALITSYATLQTEILEWLNRPTDPDAIARAPTWIQLFEAQANRRLRTVSNIKRKTNTTIAEYIALPAEWREGVKLTVQASGREWPVIFAPPSQSDFRKIDLRPSGVPDYYSVIGRSLRFVPPPDSAHPIEMVYWAELPALSDAEPTNWMLEENPDAYLFGSLVQAEAYLGNDERLAVWNGYSERAWTEIEAAAARAEMMGPIEAPPARVF